MKPAILTLIAAAPLLAACAEPEVEVSVPEPAQCDAAPFQQYVGERSPEITIPAGLELRHYRTGEPVTKDYSPSRINFEYDRTGKLVNVSCG
ncbi:MAG: I78 family peptidase inhibitor [Paracoccus sp. (in: a-proteobacteria)]|uniref:I78 family peptidase inhibitor n=1 Tax=Paracoccus sp. TaxID=267 RepID=UPI0026E034C4|nr:I78 family peptidase inhibitor [Paracoccus sp. (in: a-proteobacteria)]MDO5621956.1 I78 family peptidase inhibitor [Paracoccus sp. (in: a-proteobacteria)]